MTDTGLPGPDARHHDRAAVTIVIPTHNRRDYLAQAVDSALAQGPALEAVVVVNDGSEDSTREWLDGWDDPRLKVIHQYPGAGGSAARNRGLAEVRTPYTLFLDDDDVLEEGALDVLIRALRTRPQALGAAGAGRRFGSPGAQRHPVHPKRTIVRPLWKEILFGWGMYPSTLLWRTSVVEDLGGWNEDLRRFEDRDLVMRACPAPFVLVPQTTARLRVHASQVTNVDFDELDRRLRHDFVATLDPEEVGTADAILDASYAFEPAMAAYRRGDFASAATGLARAVRSDTTLARSPVIGPWLLGLAVKSRLLASTPPRAVGLIRSVTKRPRGGGYLPEGPRPDRHTA
jgi:glycosyltransferase involved in cell wall biosynthesis